ncbi:uncharacterized protein LOC117268614 [Epinephelus lanceolatus]|uniref:uncharacterized protein LOC117268614 n=1 Tax=Epinephelus lanceolatus TaxID=310571 RepID=UPI001444F84E|nr:uncharacterized protein LOC117268614 [Epinephelus lanceolatus]
MDQLVMFSLRHSPVELRSRKALWSARLRRSVEIMEKTLSTGLIQTAIENCENETVVQWLRANSDSEAFSKLLDLFYFLKRHIDEEEKKNHSNSVDITFVAHGAIRDSMIPASCHLPLSSVTDVVLYSPWNCTMDANVAYSVATGRIKPQHRVFTCNTKDGCQIPKEKHQPMNLPDHWNSLKKAGDQMIPNITLSPLTPQDGFWEGFQSLSKKYGEPERNRIVIPYVLPAGSVSFSVVTLALSLVLFFSRFQATVHLIACLGDQSAGRKFDRDYLRTQYACTVDNTIMTSSPDITERWIDVFKRLFESPSDGAPITDGRSTESCQK